MDRNFVNPNLAKNGLKYLPILGTNDYNIFYPNKIKSYGYLHFKQANISDFHRKECQFMLMKETKFYCPEESIRKPSLLEKKIEIIDSRLNKKNIKLKMALITQLGVGVTMVVWGILKNL